MSSTQSNLKKHGTVRTLRLSPTQVAEVQTVVFQQIEPILLPSFFLVAVEFEQEGNQWFLRVYVDKQAADSPNQKATQRISLNECVEITHLIDPLLETLPLLTQTHADLSYTLEVSSPGLFRPLKTAREFGFYQGQPILMQPQPGRSPKNPPSLKQGVLAAYDAEHHVAYLQPETVTLEATGSTGATAIPLNDHPHWQVCLNPPVMIPEDDTETPDEIELTP